MFPRRKLRMLEQHARAPRVEYQTGNCKNIRALFYVFIVADKMKIPSCSETARKHAFPLLFRHPLLGLRNLSPVSCLEMMYLHGFFLLFFSLLFFSVVDLNNNAKGGS